MFTRAEGSPPLLCCLELLKWLHLAFCVNVLWNLFKPNLITFREFTYGLLDVVTYYTLFQADNI